MMLSVIIPAYDEEKNIVKSIKEINDFFKNDSIEIIVVDDGSKDNTRALILLLKVNNVKLIHIQENKGKGNAVKMGVLQARGDRILITDADLSVPIKEYSKLEQYLSPKTPVVIASRGLKEAKVKNSFLKNILGQTGNKFIQLLIPGIKDSQCGFKLFLNKQGHNLFSRQKLSGFGYDFEILFIARKLNYFIKEVPVTWVKDEKRESSVKAHHYFQTLIELCKVYYLYKKGKYELSEI